MTPRKYEMKERAAAIERTRRRIVRATLELHAEQGIEATSWDDIARQAGVGVGTVYRHFRSLDELLPACGVLTWEKLALPGPADVEKLFRGVRSRRERIERMVRALFATYERGESELDNIRNERNLHAALEEAYRHVEGTIGSVVAAGLGGVTDDPDATRVARALTDLGTWRALRDQRIKGEDAVDVVVHAIEAWIRGKARGAP